MLELYVNSDNIIYYIEIIREVSANMHQNWQDFQKYRYKFKLLVRLFYLDLFFVILTFLS
jgi:hypothetical protein